MAGNGHHAGAQFSRVTSPESPKINTFVEPGLGTLRGPRAGAPYSPLQVSARDSPRRFAVTAKLTVTRRPLNYQPPQ